MIAAAAAAMLAGGAMVAAATPATEAFIGDGSSAVITHKIEGTGTAAIATPNNVFTEVYTSATDKTTANKLDGTHQTYGTSTKLQMVGNGTLDIIATDKSNLLRVIASKPVQSTLRPMTAVRQPMPMMPRTLIRGRRLSVALR